MLSSIRLASFLLAAGLACPLLAQPVDLSGTVTAKASGLKLPGAVVTLVNAGLSDTTDAQGSYRLAGNASRILDLPGAGSGFLDLSVRGDRIIAKATRGTDLRMDIHDLDGRRIAPVYDGRIPAGSTRIAIPLRARGSDLLALRISMDGITASCLLIGTAGEGFQIGGAVETGEDRPLVKSAADILRIRKAGYRTFEKPVTVYAGVTDAALEADGIGCAAATLCWEFEDGKLPSGSRAAQLPGQPARGPLPVVDQLQAHGGKYAMHLNNLTGQPMRDIAFTLPAKFGPILWGRAYIYITPGAPLPVAGQESSHGAFFKGIYSPDRYWYETGFEKGKYLQIQHIPEPPGFPEWVLYSEKIPASARWECVEWEFDGRAPSEPRLFVDGSEIPVTSKVGWDNGFFTEKPKDLYKPAVDFNEIWLGLDMYHPIKDKTELWFDDVAVAPVRIGCD